MGCRANFVVIQKAETSIYYTHSKGNDTPNMVAKGLNHLFVQIKRHTKEDDLMDNTWAEGGILLDLDQQVLMLWGGDDMESIPALKRHFIDHLQLTWEPWQIQGHT